MDKVISYYSILMLCKESLEPNANLHPYPTGKRDGKEWFEKEGASAEMKALNRKFDMLHGLSASLNLTSFFGLLAYGFTLGRRFQ